MNKDIYKICSLTMHFSSASGDQDPQILLDPDGGLGRPFENFQIRPCEPCHCKRPL